MTLLVLITAVLLLVLITVVGLLAGGTLIASAIYPVTMEEPIVWARLFLGIAFWAAAVAFSMPVLTDLMMILSGKSESPERPGAASRVLANILERAGIRHHGLLEMPQAATRLRGFRKLAKRSNIIVMTVVMLACFANLLGNWQWWAAVGIVFWVAVDFTVFNEEAINRTNPLTTDKMVQFGAKLLNWGAIGFFLCVLIGSSIDTMTKPARDWISATSDPVLDSIQRSVKEHFGDGESPSEHNAKATAGSEDEESDARKRAREYLKKRGK